MRTSPVNFRFPIFLDLTGKKCLVIGDHPELTAKIQALRDAGARVEWKPAFVPADLSGCFLVIASLPGNSEIFRLCEERNILCNAVDDPRHCRFSFGSVHRDGDLTVAISTNGVAPALAVRLRERIEREIGPEYGEFLTLLKEVRAGIAARVPDFAARRDLWYRIVDSDALPLLRSDQPEAARALIEDLISSTSRSDTSAPDADR
ncbi:MAG TPA: bifunctional precorrin-2 dehydrogenase/sirohydrochlorin ferrochelatase [Bryobacteraceae bacterium]|jgi:siroheme synthase-like protein|nr:bifunctional precorrin-2 dehydrogenase/sirohydrochlorin ferrochelatase [Bryobacteraceae bacterium]